MKSQLLRAWSAPATESTSTLTLLCSLLPAGSTLQGSIDAGSKAFLAALMVFAISMTGLITQISLLFLKGILPSLLLKQRVEPFSNDITPDLHKILQHTLAVPLVYLKVYLAALLHKHTHSATSSLEISRIGIRLHKEVLHRLASMMMMMAMQILSGDQSSCAQDIRCFRVLGASMQTPPQLPIWGLSGRRSLWKLKMKVQCILTI